MTTKNPTPKTSLSRATAAPHIRGVLAQYFHKRGLSVHFEVGTHAYGRRRADVLAFNTKGHITIIEVKSCWADFSSDKKMHEYLECCNQMYVACPFDIADRVRAALPPEIGVMSIPDPHEPGYGRYRLPEPKFLKKAPVRYMTGKKRRELIVRIAYRNGLPRAPKTV